MIIVYISIAVIVAALAYLGYVAYKTFKDAKPTIDSLQETATRVQNKTNAIKEETDSLKFKQQKLMTDFEKKKKAVNTVVFSVKQTPVEFKNALVAKPVAELEQKYKARQWNRKRRNRTMQPQ
ncbi:DUF948 domain-containing protein [Mesobacillus sp. AQ2]|jgi:uncharacterized protein YoxC|uniref:DUF948 domain-containing protein n=1 Tax=Bacillaceae TaxID=186817 RepID=UPI00119FA6DA|nr:MULTISPECIES: DUF948 domain-containing protein [Bacillaceae]WHX41646.1 DUF948 domain-containing protein [Mesobacillus sp. AQ2]